MCVTKHSGRLLFHPSLSQLQVSLQGHVPVVNLSAREDFLLWLKALPVAVPIDFKLLFLQQVISRETLRFHFKEMSTAISRIY